MNDLVYLIISTTILQGGENIQRLSLWHLISIYKMQEISILDLKDKLLYKNTLEMYWEHGEQITLYPLQYLLTIYVWNKQNCSRK